MKTRKIKYLFWTLAVLFLTGSAVFVMLSPVFRIDKISIAGINRITRQDVLEKLPFAEGDHILFAGKKRAREILVADGRIADVEIHRRFPNEIDIFIGEEYPELLLSAGKVWGLTGEGKLLPIDNPFEIPSLPILSGIDKEAVLIPYRRPESEMLERGLDFWRQLKGTSPQFLDKVSEIHIDENDGIALVLTGDGLLAEFDCDDCRAEILRLVAVLEDLGAERSEVSIIDLRYSDQAVVHLFNPKNNKPTG